MGSRKDRCRQQHRPASAGRVLLLLLACALVPRASAYLEEVIVSDGAGFQVGPIVHDMNTNQIVLRVTLSASMNTVPILYLSKPGWDTASPQSDNLKQHPCESGSLANSICCVNALIDQYQVAPSVRTMYDNSGICPFNAATSTWGVNFTASSLSNNQLNSHMMVEALHENDFLSTGVDRVPYNVTVEHNNTGSNNVSTGSNGSTGSGNGTSSNGTGSGSNGTGSNGVMTWETLTKYLDVLSYPDNVAYSVLQEDQGMFTVELRLNHLYLEARSRKTETAATYGGVSKYEFYVGVTYVKLLGYTAGVAISTAQVTYEYFKSDFVFMSIATEQEATPVQQFDVVLHESKSLDNFNLYQYMQFDVGLDTNVYPYPPKIEPDSLRWLQHGSFAEANSSMWNYPCDASMGYYASDDQVALDTFATQTCLPQQPTFCRFDDDNNFFMPFPTDAANPALGFIPGPDPDNTLYIQFTLKLTDSGGFKHLSTIFASVALGSWPVLQHCQDTEFNYKDVTDALQITATMGIKARKDSAAVLDQTTTINRKIEEIAGNTESPARRLLSSSSAGPGALQSPTRRLLQENTVSLEASALTCSAPICGYGRGVDGASKCNEYGTYECEKCKSASSVIDLQSYNETSFSCSWALCTVRFAGDKWKSWGTSLYYQQYGQYEDSFQRYARSMPVGDGLITQRYEQANELARMSYASWGSDTEGIPRTAKIFKAMGPKNAVVVFRDNTVLWWGDTSSDIPGEYQAARHNSHYAARKYGINYLPINLPLEDGESIVDLCPGAVSYDNNGVHFMARTDKNRVFYVTGKPLTFDMEITLLDIGTSKTVKQLANSMYAWYILFQDGSMKTIGEGRGLNVLGLNGYTGSAAGPDYFDFTNNVQTAHFPGFTIDTVKDAPFVDFGQAAVKKVASFGSGTAPVSSRSASGAGRWSNMPTQGAVPGIDSFTKIDTLGAAHMCAIMEDDSLKCWGSNWAGQLGYEDILDRGYEYGLTSLLGGSPTAENNVKDIPSVDVGTGRKVLDMCFGTASTCVVLDNYKVKCWGDNSAGTLGQEDRTRRGHEAGTMGDNLPFIDLGTDVKAVQVECYTGSVCAMTMDGQVKCWGKNCEDVSRHPYGNSATAGGGSVLPYGDFGKDGSTDGCRDRGAGIGIDFVTAYYKPRADYVEGMADALPFVNFDCSDKGNSKCLDQTFPEFDPSVAAECGSSMVTKMKATVAMPLTVEQFDEDLQDEFVTTVAIVSNTKKSQVSIVKITGVSGGSRRLLAESVEVETEIEADEGQGLDKDSQFSSESMNTYNENSPNSRLPSMTVSSFELEEKIVPGEIREFVGASSYAEATIAVEFDAVQFMEYGYASKYSYRIDNMIIMNFLGESSTQYDAILQKIARGDGFTVEKQGADDHYTLRPDFGENLLCDEVGDTSGIQTDQLKCFWRNAIVKNAVQPVAEESMYFYRKNHSSDEQDATAWIRDTVLGGGSVFSVNTATEYFNRTCPGSNDPNAETRSYGCLFVDPGYRWISRVRNGGPTSPFTISDKTVVVAVVTIVTDDGTVFRRRLLTSDQDGTQSFDLPGPGRPAAGGPVAATAAAGSRRLLAAPDPSLNLKDTGGSSAFVLNKYDVDAPMSLAYLTGLKNHRWQTLEISAVRRNNVPLDRFAGNVRAATTRLKARMGPLVHGVYCTGFASDAPQDTGGGAGDDPSRRQLLELPPAMNYTNVNISAIVEMGNNFGDIYVNELECALSALADQTELLDGAGVEFLVASCERGIISAQLRGVLSTRLSTCAVDMSALEKSECNTIRGVLAVMPLLAPPDTNQMADEAPALLFTLNLEMALEDAEADTAIADMLRQTVANALGVGVNRVLVLFAAAAAASAQRRLLTANTVATVFVYRDPRAQYSGSMVNTGAARVGATAWAAAREALEASFDAMPALGVSGGIRNVRTNPQQGDRPDLPAPRLWVVPIHIKLDTPHVSVDQGEALISHLRMVLVAQFPQLVAERNVAMHDMGAASDWSGVEMIVWVRFLGQGDATEAAAAFDAGVVALRSVLVQHLQSESDRLFSTIQASQVSLDVRDVRSARAEHVQVLMDDEEEEEEESSSGYGVVVAGICATVAVILALGGFWWWYDGKKALAPLSVSPAKPVDGMHACVRHATHGVRDSHHDRSGFAMFTRVPVFEV
jgi:hypothetical protein